MVSLAVWDFIEKVVLGEELSFCSSRDSIGAHVAYVNACNVTMRCLNDGVINLVDGDLNVVKTNRTEHDVLPIMLFREEIAAWCLHLYKELGPVMPEIVGKSNLFYWAGVCSNAIFIGEQKFGVELPKRTQQLEYIKLAIEALDGSWDYKVDGHDIYLYYRTLLIQKNNIEVVKQFAHRVRHA